MDISSKQALRTHKGPYSQKNEKKKMNNSTVGAKNICIRIPKFKFQYEGNLSDSFDNLGMKNIFSSEEADLSSISNDPVLLISDDFHQATIQVNEKGFEATAATSKLFNFY